MSQPPQLDPVSTAEMLEAAFRTADPVKHVSIATVIFLDCLENVGLTIEQGWKLQRQVRAQKTKRQENKP